MKRTAIATAFCALLGCAALTPALADDQTVNDPARHRMGDEQKKLPATNGVTTRVPDMGAGGASSGTEGRHRMGDEGTLPATGNVGTRVPEQGSGTENSK